MSFRWVSVSRHNRVVFNLWILHREYWTLRTSLAPLVQGIQGRLTDFPQIWHAKHVNGAGKSGVILRQICPERPTAESVRPALRGTFRGASRPLILPGKAEDRGESVDPAPKGIREARGEGRLRQGLLALALVLGAVPAAVLLLSTTAGGPLTYVVADALSARGGPWQVLRDLLSRAAMPTLFLILVLMLIAVWRVHRRTALVLALAVVLANVTVQAIKHSPVVSPQRLALIDPMSGHVGIVAAIALCWLVVAPRKTKALSALLAVVAITAISFGVVLAGWHTLPQVICPLLIATGWAVATGLVVPTEDGGRWATTTRLRRDGAVACLVGTVGFTAIILFAHPPPMQSEGLVPSLLTVTGVLLLLASVAAVGAVLAVGRTA